MNPEFISSLTSWVFQETGVVKVLSTEHYRQRESAEGNGTVKEDVVSSGSWSFGRYLHLGTEG